MRAAATAEPDGYTLLFASSGPLAITPALYKNLDYDPNKNFAPVATVSSGPMVLVVSPACRSIACKSWSPMPRPIRASSITARPSALRRIMAWGLFTMLTGTDIVYVPYKGAAAAFTDLVAGQIQMNFDAIGSLLPLIREGKLRALAVSSASRNPDLPEVPTMVESGIDFLMSFWTAVLAPVGTPPDIVSKLNATINAGLGSAEMKATLAKFQVEAKVGSPQDFARISRRGDEEMGGRREGGEHQGRVSARRGHAMIRKRLLPAAVIALGLATPHRVRRMRNRIPDRPIRLIVPFPPGGPTDYVARLVAQHVSANLGQVVLDNRPGAGGTIASKAVANAEPDGYTLLYGSSATLGIAPALYKNVEYDPIKSFAPVALVSRVPFVLGVAAAVPANTLSEFIAYAKANPGKLNFGATIGTPAASGGRIVQGHDRHRHPLHPLQGRRAGDDGSAGGPDAHDHRGRNHPSRRIFNRARCRPLAVMSPQRLPALPDVPTMLENGYSGFPPASWTGVLAPAGTPASIVGKLNAAINDAPPVARDQHEFRQVQRAGEGRIPAGLRRLHRRRSPEMGRLVKDSGAKLE